MAAMMPMITTTITSSIRLNAVRRAIGGPREAGGFIDAPRGVLKPLGFRLCRARCAGRGAGPRNNGGCGRYAALEVPGDDRSGAALAAGGDGGGGRLRCPRH